MLVNDRMRGRFIEPLTVYSLPRRRKNWIIQPGTSVRMILARHTQLMFHRSNSLTLWAVVVLGVLLRAAAMLRGAGAFDDPDNYLALARAVAAGDGLSLNGRPTAYRPPLYPLLLAPSTLVLGKRVAWGIALFHLGLGAGTIWLTAAAAKISGLSSTRSIFAAFVTACDPVLVWQSRSVMTETPTAFLLAATLAALGLKGWRGPALGGLGLGLAALCRPSMLAGAALTLVAALVVQPGDRRTRFIRGSLVGMTGLLVLFPWFVRNLLVFGEPIWTTTHGGYTLALANNPVYYDDVLRGPPGRVWTGHDQFLWWDSVNRQTAGMTEAQSDRYLRQMVWRVIRERPADFARATLARLGHFWSVAPAATVYSGGVRWATMAWTVPLWLAIALGLAQRDLWRWPRIAAPLAAIGLALVHGLFWTDLRMRAPIVPAISLIAAGAGLPLATRKPAGVRDDPARSSQGWQVD
jgi:4-amino-4-deoxy-L-arabinose transferase-like glycosyltransferase